MSIQGISYQTTNYTALSSGSKINSAADNAAGSAISNKLQAQSNGLSAASSNAKAGQDLLRVSDGALSSIQDSLQRIRELSVKAGNATYSDADRQAIQKEIDGLKQDIQGTAKGTSFNTKKLLDGSTADLNLAVNPQGGTKQIQLADSTLESLGIADYDVTGTFDIQDIDNAIKMVSSARGSMGAQSNALDYAVSANDYANYNTMKSLSKITDTDYGEEVTEQKKNQVLEQYQIFSQKAKMQNEAGILKLF
jgi:flagellin